MPEKTKHRPRWRRIAAALLLGLGLLCCALMLLPNLPDIFTRLWVQVNAARYDEVIRQIQNGTLPGFSVSGNRVNLPPAYQNLSPAGDGQVLVYQLGASQRVLFYLPSNSPLTTRVYMYASVPPCPATFKANAPAWNNSAPAGTCFTAHNRNAQSSA
jgi:hypothetical protein